MIAQEWFSFRGRWHILATERSSLCKIELVDPPTVVRATEEEPSPPNPCTKCLLAQFEGMVEEEPLDEAFARGFAVAPQD